MAKGAASQIVNFSETEKKAITENIQRLKKGVADLEKMEAAEIDVSDSLPAARKALNQAQVLYSIMIDED